MLLPMLWQKLIRRTDAKIQERQIPNVCGFTYSNTTGNDGMATKR